MLPGNVDNRPNAAKVNGALANDGHETGVHGQVLDDIGPDDGLDAAERRINAADDAHYQDRRLHIDRTDLVNRQRRRIDDDAGVDDCIEGINHA